MMNVIVAMPEMISKAVITVSARSLDDLSDLFIVMLHHLGGSAI